MRSRATFLGDLPAFEALDEDELEDLADAAQELIYQPGAVVAYQRDVANALYIVRKGRLYAEKRDTQGVARDAHAYMPGDMFGEVWLFAPRTHPKTVKSSGNTHVIIISSDAFLRFLERNRQVIPKLEPEYNDTGDIKSGLSEEAWAEAEKLLNAEQAKRAVDLLPDELVEYRTRRSVYYLLLQLFLPVLGLLVVPLLTYGFLVNSTTPFIVDRVAPITAVILALLFLLIIAFQAYDWANDYFVITNKHVTHREFDLRTFRISVTIIPNYQIQSVEIAKPNLIANILNIGTVRMTTASSTGILLFENIDDPLEVKEVLDRLAQRVRSLSQGREQASMRRSIEKHFELAPAYEVVSDEEDEEGDGIYYPQDLTFWQRVSEFFSSRIEADGVIQYRKHVFVLFMQTILPISAGIILLILLFLANLYFPFPLRYLIFSIFFVINLAWFIWRFEDWRNDTFQIADSFVVDIDRQPFGFGESRKQAGLANIQNINADRPGLLPTIFNYGNVIIEVAGTNADLVFENVANPSRVQADIFGRLDRYREQQQIREGERRRQEYGVLLDVYKQAMEQNRIPRRTPDDQEIDYEP